MIPDDISVPAVPSADLRIVLKSAARLKNLAPDAITVADPLAFTGCGRNGELRGRVKGGDDAAPHRLAVAGTPGTNGHTVSKKRVGSMPPRNGAGRAAPRAVRRTSFSASAPGSPAALAASASDSISRKK